MTVPVQQVSLIEARNALNVAVNKQRGGIPSNQDDIDLAFAALDIAITKTAQALAASDAALRAAKEQNDDIAMQCHGWLDDLELTRLRLTEAEATLRTLQNDCAIAQEAAAQWRDQLAAAKVELRALQEERDTLKYGRDSNLSDAIRDLTAAEARADALAAQLAAIQAETK